MRPILVLLTGWIWIAATPLTQAEIPNFMKLSLFHAQNSEIRDDLEEGSPLKKSLRRLVGYERYERIGEATADLSRPGRKELSPSPMFCLVLTPKPEDPRIYHYALLQKDQLILEGSLTPKNKVPLIITGPEYGRGRLVLIVECAKK